MFRKIAQAYRSLSIKKKLFVCIVLVSLAPQSLLVARFFETSKSALTDTTQGNIHQLVMVNNEMINEQLTTVRQTTMNILVDSELFEIFNNANFGGVIDRAAAKKEIHNVLNKYFGSLPCVEQVCLITRGYVYPMTDSKFAQYEGFFESQPCLRIVAKNGGIVWLTKQDMGAYWLGKPKLSSARLLNLTYVGQSGIGVPLPKSYERPVIHVQFADAFFADRLGKNLANLHDAEFYLMDDEGNPLIQGGDYLDFEMHPDWWAQIKQQGSGMLKVETTGRKQTVVCFDRLKESGWTSAVAFSVDALAGELIGGMSRTFFAVVCVLILSSLIATLLAISMIAKRIKSLDQGVDALKAGDFRTIIVDYHRDEFTYLVDNFNGMSVTLRRLIDENYKVRLSEQEARLQTLMMQFNPHYLYNTLNVINWVAMRGNTKRTSALIVSLAKMLRYTSDNRRDCTELREDIEWIEQYLVLMQARFEGLFEVRWDVDTDCLDAELPKLFMQPLLENSILHGFSDRTSGGEIAIRVFREGGDVLCEVRDNGVGMSAERIEHVLKQEGVSIGLFNIHKRIQLMYGDEYGLSIQSAPSEGCLVRVRIKPKAANEPMKTQVSNH